MAQIYTNNSGLVLLSPFLPQLFKSLNLVEDESFVDRESAERAALLLQYITNSSTDTPEYQLALNKLMCGITPGEPVPRSIDVSAKEKERVDGLLRAVIEHWGALGNSSVEGLQSSFLEREGRLEQKDDEWLLEVEPRPYDMLLDRLPWTFQTIKLPWMKKVLHVNWR